MDWDRYAGVRDSLASLALGPVTIPTFIIPSWSGRFVLNQDGSVQGHTVKYRYLPLEEDNPDISGQFHPYMAYQGKHVVKKHHEEKPKIFLTYLQYDNMVYRHRYGEYPRPHTFKDGIRVDLQTWPLVPLGAVVKMTAGETQGQKGVVSSQPYNFPFYDPRPKFCLASPLEPIRRSDAKATTR
jgi:hypothetical protein